MPTTETTISHAFRYGSITKREGTRNTSYQVRIRKFDDSSKWVTLTVHSLADAYDTLDKWNKEREEAFRAHAFTRR